MVGTMQWELIQPLDDSSIYAEFLAAKGEGLHHVGVGGAAAVRRDARHVARARVTPSSRAASTTGHLRVPLDRPDLGVMTEIFDLPAGLKQEPDAVYPAS